MKALVIVSLLALLSGCAVEHGTVRCNGRLEPINMPALRVTAVPAAGAPLPPPAAQGPIGGSAP